MTKRTRSQLALLFLAPAPTIGIAAALSWWPGPIGQAVFTVAKIWLVAFPVAWLLLVDRGRISWSPPRNGGLGVGALIGLGMAAAIGATCWLVALPRIDAALMRSEAADMGLTGPMPYILGALYWIFVNSVIEEYVFRWFIQSHCEVLWTRPVAILVSAAIFTFHHTVAMSNYLSPGLNALASSGVFFAGAVWSWMISRYRSIWPGWIAHALADIAVFGCGYWLLFGS